MTDRDGEIAGRLRALAASPDDPESLRRGLLWVAGEVQASEQATRLATEQMAALTARLAAVELREQELTRATAGIDSFRREFLWLSGEVQARGEALTRATAQIETLTGELTTLRQANARMEALAVALSALRDRLEAGMPSPDVRGELDRYAAETTGSASFAELARAALRSGEAVRELHDEVLASQQSAMAQVAGRTAPLEGALHELRRELDRIADASTATNLAVRTEVGGHVATIDQRLKALETLQGELDGVYRELDRLSGHLSGGDGLLTEVAERLLPLEEAVVATRRELVEARGDTGSVGARIEAIAGRVSEATARLDEAEARVGGRVDEVEARVGGRVDEVDGRVNQRVSEVEGRINQRVSEVADLVTVRVVEVADELSLRVEAVAGEVEGVGTRIDVLGERIDLVDDRIDTVGERLNSVDERLATLGVLTSDIEGMYRELDRVAELTLSRDGALAQVADRTTPLEISVSGLRQELERLGGEVLAAHQATLAQVADRVDAVADRVGPIELLVDQVAELGHELRRVSEEAGSAQQAALAATTEQLGLAGRLRMLEGLPSDIEGMYRDFQRVAEAAASRDDHQGDARERQAAVDAAIEGLRAELERVAAEGQNTELDLRRRLSGLESLTGDLDSLYRELGRVTALATDHEDRSVTFETTVAGVRDSLSELRERIEDERIYTTEQVTGLWARMRAVEGVPADIERVATEIESLAAAVTRAFGDSNENVDEVARRVGALERLPSDIEVVQREIDGLAAVARQREEQIAGLRDQLEPLGSALADLRAEIDRVRSDMASVSEAPAQLAAFDDRLGKLEGLPETVADALRELGHTSDEVMAGHQASLASASVLLQDFNERLQALEALPADMEGLYAALYRVAESVKALREDAETS